MAGEPESAGDNDQASAASGPTKPGELVRAARMPPRNLRVRASADFQAGVAAFREKRKPRYAEPASVAGAPSFRRRLDASVRPAESSTPSAISPASLSICGPVEAM